MYNPSGTGTGQKAVTPGSEFIASNKGQLAQKAQFLNPAPKQFNLVEEDDDGGAADILSGQKKLKGYYEQPDDATNEEAKKN